MTSPVDINRTRALAATAGLALSEERLAACADLLAVWLRAADELSAAMAAPEHDRLMPVTLFVQPWTDTAGE